MICLPDCFCLNGLFFVIQSGSALAPVLPTVVTDWPNMMVLILGPVNRKLIQQINLSLGSSNLILIHDGNYS